MKGGQLLAKDLRVLLFPSSIKTGSHDIGYSEHMLYLERFIL
jgi:hypothetical protein